LIYFVRGSPYHFISIRVIEALFIKLDENLFGDLQSEEEVVVGSVGVLAIEKRRKDRGVTNRGTRE
jgi:hypothetical protein